MKLNKIHLLFFLSILFMLPACNQKSTQSDDVDPLPSWNDGATKTAILDYVNDVTNAESEYYIEI